MSLDLLTTGQENELRFTFRGPYPGSKDPRKRNKGVMAVRRAQKREEAELRNAQTPPEKTARWRRLSTEQRNEWLVQSSPAVHR